MDEITTPELVERPWEDLERLLDEGDRNKLAVYFEQLAPAEVSRCIDRLDAEHRDMVLGLLDAEAGAELLEHLSEAQGLEMIEHAEPAQAAAIVEELPSDWQADLIAAMPPQSAASILEQMDPQAADAARQLAAYPSDTAGGLMMREFVVFAETTTVKAVKSCVVAPMKSKNSTSSTSMWSTRRVDSVVCCRCAMCCWHAAIALPRK